MVIRPVEFLDCDGLARCVCPLHRQLPVGVRKVRCGAKAVWSAAVSHQYGDKDVGWRAPPQVPRRTAAVGPGAMTRSGSGVTLPAEADPESTRARRPSGQESRIAREPTIPAYRTR